MLKFTSYFSLAHCLLCCLSPLHLIKNMTLHKNLTHSADTITSTTTSAQLNFCAIPSTSSLHTSPLLSPISFTVSPDITGVASNGIYHPALIIPVLLSCALSRVAGNISHLSWLHTDTTKHTNPMLWSTASLVPNCVPQQRVLTHTTSVIITAGLKGSA